MKLIVETELSEPQGIHRVQVPLRRVREIEDDKPLPAGAVLLPADTKETPGNWQIVDETALQTPVNAGEEAK